MSKQKNISSENMEDNIKSMNQEDLANWKPKVNTEYNGYNYTNKFGHRRIGYTIIYFRKKDDNSLEEHYGGFDIIDNQVKIWYMDGNQKIQRFVSISQCKFSKTIQGNVNYYHCIIDANLKGNNMTTENKNSDEGYKPYVEPVGFWDRLLKRTDPVYWKKTIQAELDKRWTAFDTTTEKLKEDFEKFNRQAMEITEEEHNVETTNQEWAGSLTSLGNLLNKNTSHEKQMWDTTQRNRNVKGLKIKQKFKDSDVDEIRFNNMMEYIKQYPELQTQKTIDKLVENVKAKREDIVAVSKTYRQTIKETNVYLNIVKNKLQGSEDELAAFEKMKKEGEQKVNDAQSKGFINKIINRTKTAAEKESTRLNFFEYDRKIDVSKNQLKLIGERIKKYEDRKFKPIVTTKFADIEE